MPPDKPRESGRVALYARTWAGYPDNSLEVQVETLHEYTRRRRLEAVRVHLETRSARSQFHEMMADATREDPMFRKIPVHDMSRLSRWLGGLGALRDRLEASGVTVVSRYRRNGGRGPLNTDETPEPDPEGKTPDGP